MSEDWILKAIAPKSDQLNAEDLVAGPIDVTVQEVKQGNSEQPVVIVIGDGRQPYKPCKSMTRVMVQTWGKSPSDWKGQRMRLYCDPKVKWAGEEVGGIRISHISGIEKPTPYLVTLSKAKRSKFVLHPMPDAAPDNRVDKAIAWMDEVDSIESLEKFDGKLNELIKGVRKDDGELLKQARKNAVERLIGVGE